MSKESDRATFQSAKTQARPVRIVLRDATIGSARVLDVDGDDVHVQIGERDRRRVQLGQVLSVTLL